MLHHDVADGSLCPVPTVHTVIPTEWSIGHNGNVDEGLQVCTQYTLVITITFLFLVIHAASSETGPAKSCFHYSLRLKDPIRTLNLSADHLQFII